MISGYAGTDQEEEKYLSLDYLQHGLITFIQHEDYGS